MRKFVIAAGLIGAMGAAGSAMAGPGQCYDAYGRPVGPAYDTDHPNYGFLDSVVRRGGTCTGMNNPSPRRRYGYDDNRRDNYNRGDDGYDDDRRGYRNRGSRSREQRPPPREPNRVEPKNGQQIEIDRAAPPGGPSR